MLYKISKLDSTLHRLELVELCGIMGLTWPTGTPFDERRVKAGDALVVWLSGLLSKRKPVTEAQKRLLLTFYCARLRSIGDELAADIAAEKKTLPVATLVIVDNTFVAVSGGTEWLDLRSGEPVKDLPMPPIEAVSYNLTALFTALNRLYTKQGEKNAD